MFLHTCNSGQSLVSFTEISNNHLLEVFKCKRAKYRNIKYSSFGGILGQDSDKSDTVHVRIES